MIKSEVGGKKKVEKMQIDEFKENIFFFPIAFYNWRMAPFSVLIYNNEYLFQSDSKNIIFIFNDG